MDMPLTVRFEREEIREIDEAAKALGVSRAEVVRRVWRNKSGARNEEMHELLAVIAATVSELSERQTEGANVAVDLSPAMRQFEILANAQARTERAISSLIDAIEKLQNRSGYRDPAQQNFGSQPQPTQHQNRPQATPATSMSFTAWKMANPIREGESPTDFNARSRTEYLAAGGRL